MSLPPADLAGGPGRIEAPAATGVTSVVAHAPEASGRYPDVVVVIPTRGSRPQLLQRAVNSVLSNGYPGRVSVTVVTDDVPADYVEVDRSGGSVTVLPNTRAAGLAGARNTGLLHAGADVVAFCDDDDEWLPGKLRKQVDLLLARPQAMLIGCGITVVQGPRATHRRSPATVTYGDLLRNRVMELHSSTVVLRRRPVLDQVGLLDEELPGGFGEDYDLLLRVARRSAVVTVPEPLVLVHWHGGSFYTSRWEMIAAGLEYLLHKHSDFRRSRRGRARIEGQIAFALAASRRRVRALRFAALGCWHWPGERRVFLALLIVLGVGSAERFEALAQRNARGL